MLRELSVQNLATIEDVQIALEDGFCVWSGETGAGKSLLLSALGLVLGGKASADLVRAGKPEARAGAVFEIEHPTLRADLEEILGASLEDGTLIVNRRVSAQGRSAAQVNGMPVTIATLQKLGERLIDVHGQFENRALVDPDRQRSLLDAFGGLEELHQAYAEARGRHDQLRRARQALIDATQARQRERSLLEFERGELATLAPRSGEHDELVQESHILANSEALRTAAVDGHRLLYEADRSAQEVLCRVARSLEPLAKDVPELADAATTLERLADETREVAYTLRDLGQGWDEDPERLEDVEARLAQYRKLSNHFHREPDELAALKAEIEAKLAAIERDETDLKEFDKPLAEAWAALKRAAAALSEGRRKTAKDFGKAIQARLKCLGMDRARLSVEVEFRDLGDDPTAPPPPESGADRVEMIFLANPGEVPQPLRKIASGGELSRVTLAAKAVLAAVDRVPTLVFDEIDTGVGGRLGSALGKTLADLAKHHQVVCVTHLPQMASYAHKQWVIRKQVERGRTRTTIAPLAETERVAELAAMLRGDSAVESTRREAREMLREAREAVGVA
ncbi:DNA repair protein RecN [Planctomyces sp. SH-PL62]|uniref:DNA repair protein RecN n=1 Tax=Planctomyces sp. SH-PL62 TaxID=1636152 RepID=UPI00078B53C4|nr:DNA repair protein RecN [Planctomyces sp. SH-PL62]AMV36589.1 DNA repair protein RecN [Planctomyces sp. SH-PL62]